MQLLALCAATRPFLSVRNIVQRYYWHWYCADNSHVRFWVFRWSLWRILCNYSIVGCDETYVRSLEKQVMISLVISEIKFCVFNSEHITQEMNPKTNKRHVPLRNKVLFTLKQW